MTMKPFAQTPLNRSFLLVAAAFFLFLPAVSQADDPWEASDNAMAHCVDTVIPGFRENMIQAQKNPQETMQQFTSLTEKMGDISDCMKEQGFESTEIDDFSMYMDDTMEDVRNNKAPTIPGDPGVQPMAKGGVAGAQGGQGTTGKPAPKEATMPNLYVNPGQKDNQSGKPSLFVPQD